MLILHILYDNTGLHPKSHTSLLEGSLVVGKKQYVKRVVCANSQYL